MLSRINDYDSLAFTQLIQHVTHFCVTVTNVILRIALSVPYTILDWQHNTASCLGVCIVLLFFFLICKFVLVYF